MELVMKVGLMIMKGAPLHRHHVRLLTELAMLYKNSIVLFGKNSWFSYDDRKEMVKNVFGDRFHFGEIEDIGGTTTRAWGVHVFKTVAEMHLCSDPNESVYLSGYVGGRREDCFWLKDFFRNEEFRGDIEWDYIGNRCINRYLHAYDPATNTINDDAPQGDRYLHMVRDEDHSHISATAIRTYLLLGDDYWKTMVPEVNHKLVQEAYMRGKNE
jgi:nicotinamide mononucleotide adenylyltransferase